jgi:hypothetical protein
MMIAIAALFGVPKPPDSAKALPNFSTTMGLSRHRSPELYLVIGAQRSALDL